VPLVVRWQGRYGHGVARPPVGVVAGGGLGLVAGLYLAWQVLRRLTRSG
jgi:hypothetical protein